MSFQIIYCAISWGVGEGKGKKEIEIKEKKERKERKKGGTQKRKDR